MKFDNDQVPANLADKTIGDVIGDCVPAEHQHFFAILENGVADKEWWTWNLELDDEDSIGTHVWNLLPEICEVLAWMPDASDAVIESFWQAAGDQCLTWVRG